MRRLWWGVSVAGFAVFITIAFLSNRALGLALLALTAVIIVMAYFYDRGLRRR
ncbi:MAG: hypothetical protein ACYDCQ_21025 [Dehalococcoidia bacterium]